jgi:ribulose-phosphate 3-epimerase
VVHAEACVHLHRTISLIHEFGIRAGVSLNPATPLVLLDDILPDIEMILIMTVNPGFGGQKHIVSARKKITEAKKRIDQLEKDVLIEADGGVGPSNIAEVSQAGCDIFVAGSAIFKSENWADTIRLMKERGGFTD